jgi:hypothetical protein
MLSPEGWFTPAELDGIQRRRQQASLRTEHYVRASRSRFRPKVAPPAPIDQ